MKEGYLYMVVGLHTNHQFKLGDIVEGKGELAHDGCSPRSGVVVGGYYFGTGELHDCWRVFNDDDSWWIGTEDLFEIGKI